MAYEDFLIKVGIDFENDINKIFNDKLKPKLQELEKLSNIKINFNDGNIVDFQNKIKLLQNQVNNSQIEIKFDKDKLDKQLENIKKKLEKAGNEDVDIKWNGKANTAIIKYTDELGNAQKQVYKLGEVSEKVGDEIQKHFKFKLFIDDNQLKNNDVFLELKKRQIEIEKFANTKAKIDIKADGKDNIQSAIITWTDNVGRLQKEYYKLNETLTETQNKIKKTTSFDLTQTTYTDNIEKSRKALNNLKEEFKSLQKETSNLTYGNTSQNFNENYVKGIKEIKTLLSDLNNGNKIGITQEELNNINKYLDTLKLENAEVKNSIGYEKERTQVLNEEAKIRKQIEKEATGGNKPETAKNSAYQELNKLQKEEFALKEKILGAEGSEREELEGQLQIIKQQQLETVKLMKQYNLRDADKNNSFLIERKKLTSDLAIAQNEYNKKLQEEQHRIQTLVKQTQDTYKNRINNIKTSYGEFVPQAQLESFQNKLKDLNATSMSGLRSQIKDLSNEFGKLNAEAKQAKQESKTGLFNELGFALEKFGNWLVVGTILMQSINAVKQGIKSIIELDTAMIDLKKVTDESNESYAKFVTNINQVAISVGHTTKSAIEATTEFAKLGYSIKEAQELAKNSLIYSNIGEIPIEKATKSIISTMKGFGLQSSETLKILDMLNEVGNKNGLSSAVSGEALQRSASALKESNNSLAESLGLITAVHASIQDDGEKSGTALKTMSMRLRGVKDDAGEIVPKIREKIKSITDIDIMKNENTFKSTFQIMKELSSVYDTLTDKNRAYLQELVGGKMQGNAFASIMQNMEDGVKATETALNSEGSAMKEQERYMDSFQAKLNELKETLVKFFNEAINSEGMKRIVEMGTGLINLVDKFGGFNTVIFASTLGLLTFNKTFREFVFKVDEGGNVTSRFAQAFNKLDFSKGVTYIDGVAKGFDKAGNATKRNIAMLDLFGVTIDVVKLKAVALQTILSVGLSLAFTAAVSYLSKIFTQAEETNKKIEDMMNSLPQKNQEFFDQSKMAAQFDELSQKKNRSSEEDKKLIELQRELAKLFPSVADGVDKEGNAIVTNTEALKDLINQKRELLKLENETMAAKAKAELPKIDSSIETDRKRLEEVKEQIKIMREAGATKVSTGVVKTDIKDLEKLQETLVASISELTGEQDKYKAALNIVNTVRKQEIQEIANQNTQYRTAKVVSEELNNSLKQQYTQEEINDALIKNNTKNINDNTKAKEKNAQVKKTEENYKKAEDDLESSTKSLEFYYKMLDELHDKNKLSKSSVDEIFKTQQDLIPFIGNEAELREKVNQKIKDEEKLQKEVYQNMIANSTEYYNAKIKGNADTTNKIQDMYKTFTKNLGNGYNVDLQNYHNLEQAKGDMTSKLLKGLLSQWGSYWGSFSQYWDDAKGDFDGNLWYGLRNNPEESKKFEEIRDKVNSFKKKFNEITIDPIKIDFTPINSSGVTPDKEHKEKKEKKSPKEAIKDMDVTIDRYLKEKEAINRVNEELQKSKTLEESLYGDKLIKQKEYGIQLLIQRSQLTDELYNKQKEDMSNSEKLLHYFGMNAENGTVSNYKEVIEAKTAWANSINSSEDDRKNAQEHVKQLQEEVKKYFELSKATTESRTSWQQMQQEVVKIKQEIIDTTLTLKEDPLKPILETTKNLSAKISLMNIDENAKLDTLINKYKEKLSLSKELLENQKKEQAVYSDEINYLTEQLATVEKGSKAWEEINNKLISYQDKLRSSTQTIKDQNIAIKNLILDIFNKETENAIYNGSKRQFEDDKNAQINALKKELDDMKEADEKEKLSEDRANKEKEMADIKRKIQILKNGSVKNISDDLARELGLEQEKERAIQRQLDLQEKLKKLDEEKKKALEEYNKKIKELNEQLKNLMNNETVQHYTKTKDGWQMIYDVDMEEINKINKEKQETQDKFNEEMKKNQDEFNKDKQKTDKDNAKELKKQIDNLNQELKKKQEDFSRWERDNQRKVNEQKIQNEIEALQDELKVREEFLTRAKQDLAEAFADEENMYDVSGDKVHGIVEGSLDRLKNLYGDKFADIIETVKNAVREINYSTSQIEMPDGSSGGNDDGWSDWHGADDSSSRHNDTVKMTEDLFNKIYLSENSDVARALQRGVDSAGNPIDFGSGIEHFKQFGQYEDRPGSEWYYRIGQWIRKNELPMAFDTGGYTGDWGDNDGKMAILHKKELILNQGQTKDYLESIKMSKELMDSIKNINLSQGFKDMVKSVTNVSIPSVRVPELVTKENTTNNNYRVEKVVLENVNEPMDLFKEFEGFSSRAWSESQKN